MIVKDWINYDNTQQYQENGIGGLGGFFNFQTSGMRWKDYIETFELERDIIYIEALRYEIVNKNIKEAGSWHQNSGVGVPLFEDDTIAKYSYRAWGDLMAAIWSEQENRDYCYIDFYI